METLVFIIGALATGALAKIGGRASGDAYDLLKALLVKKLGKSGAVQSVEDEPRSEKAQEMLAESLSKAGLADDPELAELAHMVRAAAAEGSNSNGADIEVGAIYGKVNVLVNNLAASGRIKLGDIRAETGDATISNLTAGAGGVAPKKD